MDLSFSFILNNVYRIKIGVHVFFKAILQRQRMQQKQGNYFERR